MARAEKALAELSPEFGNWMDSECDRLDRARHDVVKTGITQPARRRFSAPRTTSRAKPQRSAIPRWLPQRNSLCRLIEHTPEISRIPLALIDQHVDAIRAIYREYARSDAKKLAATLTTRLREVTE